MSLHAKVYANAIYPLQNPLYLLRIHDFSSSDGSLITIWSKEACCCWASQWPPFWATLLKKMTPERKGITFVTSFGRQKAFWLEMYHLHMFFHLFKKVAAKSQCFAFFGQMHNLGLGKGLWKESMHFFPTCLNCSERWYHLSKMEDGQDFPRKGLNCKF